MENVIEKTVDLPVGRERVRRAVADAAEFGEWFRVKFEGPFVVGEEARGRILHKRMEKYPFKFNVEAMETELCFVYTWTPYAIDPEADYSREKPTRVEFVLEEIAGGTRLTVREKGFAALPAARREEAWRMHAAGWAQQMVNITEYLKSH